jgi:hypothetical protein
MKAVLKLACLLSSRGSSAGVALSVRGLIFRAAIFFEQVLM